ncbi:MAG: phage holin family protein [Nocardioidaceae bacterium]|jgi:ABC-type multidrug transport system fused ATPase/permease subunit
MATISPEPKHDEEPTIGKLVADTSRDLSALIRNEIELAKTEIKISLKFGGVGAGLLAAAAFIGLLAIIIVSIAFALFLDWWFAGTATAFLIVFAIYLLVAGVLAFLGIKNVKRARAPQQTIAAVKSNKQILKRG